MSRYRSRREPRSTVFPFTWPFSNTRRRLTASNDATSSEWTCPFDNEENRPPGWYTFSPPFQCHSGICHGSHFNFKTGSTTEFASTEETSTISNARATVALIAKNRPELEHMPWALKDACSRVGLEGCKTNTLPSSKTIRTPVTIQKFHFQFSRLEFLRKNLPPLGFHWRKSPGFGSVGLAWSKLSHFHTSCLFFQWMPRDDSLRLLYHVDRALWRQSMPSKVER